MTIKVTYNITDVYMSQSVSPVYITVSYSDGGASGGGVWGTITGTLSNQTDLQNALDAKLDESTIDGGAEGQILSKASATDFDFAWINNYAKYLATNVRNQTGSTIGAFQVVYISGATGNKPLISLADADTEATSSKTYGVTATAIANNGTGDVVTAGELSGIDTSAFTEGDSLWLSTTAGGVVTSPPAEPAHSVFIGTVIRSHPTLGVIDVAIANGYELTELHGVQITTPTDNQGLFYNSTSTLWENKTIDTALGYTPANAATTITINGVTYDLSANRSWTVAAGLSGTIATGQVAFGTAADTIGGSNNLFWDATNGRLGIGTDAPSDALTVRASGTSQIFVSFKNSLGNNIVAIRNNSNNTVNFFLNDSAGSPSTLITTSGNSYFNSGGNYSFGTTSDLGVRLGVVGDTLLRGSGNTSATTALTVQNSSSTNLFRVRNNGDVSFGSDAMYWDAVNSRLGIGVTAPTSKLYIQDASTATVLTLVSLRNNFNSVGTGVAIDFIPESTNSALSRIIATRQNLVNGYTSLDFQTYDGTATTTALYIAGTANRNIGILNSNPTARLDIPASVTTAASLRIRSGTAPTTPNDGDIWFDGTNIKMRIGGVTKTFTLI